MIIVPPSSYVGVGIPWFYCHYTVNTDIFIVALCPNPQNENNTFWPIYKIIEYMYIFLIEDKIYLLLD